MLELNPCPACGTALPPNAPAGVCPKCLLRAGLHDAATVSGDSATGITAAMAPPDAPTMPLAGQRGEPANSALPSGTRIRYFGDYELLDEIARGGMGIVYKARQVRLNRIVALKMILAGRFADEVDVGRLHTEAEAAAQLDHPGIVPIFEVGEHGGFHFFSMGLVDGQSLAHRMAAGPLNPTEVAELVRKVARAIEYAHAKGVVHRDLKPANILIGGDGQPRVTDFGLAKKIRGDSGLTATGQILGTPGYMPPEQAAGRVDQVNEAADIYSLGAVLYATLTGRPPFQSDNPLDTLRHVLDSEPLPPRTLVPNVPVDLETICLKCLEKDPRRRYASAGELSDELRRFLDGEPILARPIRRTARAWRWCRRNPLVASLSAAAVLSLVLGTVVSTLFAIEARLRAAGEARQRGIADRNALEAGTQRDNAQDQLWETLVAQARAERLAGRRWESWQAIASAAGMKRSDRLRTEAIQTVTQPGVRLRHTIPFGQVWNLSFNGNGTMLAAAGSYALPPGTGATDASRIVVWDMPTARRIGTTTIPTSWSGTATFAFDPVASSLFLQTDEGEAALWDPVTGERVTEFGTSRAVGGLWLGGRWRPNQAVFSPDARLVAFKTDQTLHVWKTDDGNEAARRSLADPIAFLTPDVLLLWDKTGLKRWETTTGVETAVLPDSKTVLDVTPDGRWVAVSDAGAVGIWDSMSGEEAAALPAFGERVQFACLSPDGRLVALQSHSAPGTIRIWDSVTGDLKQPISGVFGSQGYNTFNQDGTLLAGQAGNRVVKIWNVETAEELSALRGDDAPVWSPDGRFLATVGAGSFDVPEGGSRGGSAAQVNVWEVAYPTPYYTELPLEPIEHLLFSPGGERLATDRAVWDVVPGSDKPLLRRTRLEQPSPISALSAGGEVWSLQSGPKRGTASGIPESPVTLKSSAPQESAVEISIPGNLDAHAISADGRFVALSSEIQEFDTPGATGGRYRFRGYALELHDLATGKRLWSRTEPQQSERFTCLAFSPDGKSIATGRQNAGVDIRDVATGNMLHPSGIKSGAGTTIPVCVAFSPDGRLVAFSDEDGEIVIGSAEDGNRLAILHGTSRSVLCLAVHPGGRILASGGMDRMIRLCELPSARRLAEWEAHNDSVTAVAFSPDGDTLASGGADSTVKVWNIPYIREQLAAVGLDW